MAKGGPPLAEIREGDVGQNKFHFQELRTEMTYEWPRQFQAPCDGYLFASSSDLLPSIQNDKEFGKPC